MQLKRYLITWTERHSRFVDAVSRDEAITEALSCARSESCDVQCEVEAEEHPDTDTAYDIAVEEGL